MGVRLHQANLTEDRCDLAAPAEGVVSPPPLPEIIIHPKQIDGA